jgi:alkylation response protein AidB-like acyl-CoA dehydrogenase
MDFGLVELTPEQEEFRRSVRTLLDEVVTQDDHDFQRATGNGHTRVAHAALGAHGLIRPAWAPEDGGIGADKVQQRLLELEFDRAELIQVSAGTSRLVWSAIETFGEKDLVAELKPKYARGEALFCLGYTEPDGGSDIAAAKVRAVKDGDEWVINGSKIFTTGAQNCTHCFLITRTDPDLPKHRGLTMFLVPLDTPGVEIQGIRTFGGERTNIVYYSDVRISDHYRLGGVNDGWTVLRGPLDEEHAFGQETDGLKEPYGRGFTPVLERAYDAAVEWAQTHVRADGTHPIDDPVVRIRLAQVAADMERTGCVDGPEGRVFGADVIVRCSADLVDLVGPEAVLSYGSDGAGAGETAAPDGPPVWRIDFSHRFAQGTPTYGGTVEVFRQMIAQHVLGLPRPNFPGSKAFINKRGAVGAPGVTRSVAS